MYIRFPWAYLTCNIPLLQRADLKLLSTDNLLELKETICTSLPLPVAFPAWPGLHCRHETAIKKFPYPMLLSDMEFANSYLPSQSQVLFKEGSKMVIINLSNAYFMVLNLGLC
jgi:hypothetical protein